MSEERAHVRLILAFSVLLLVGAACGGDSEAPPEGESPITTGATGPTGATEPTGPTGDGAAVTVQANNFSFDPSELEVASGTAIEVRNGNANTPHTFTVIDTEIDLELGGLESGTVTVDLDPGTYDFECRFHPQMTGTLTVT